MHVTIFGSGYVRVSGTCLADAGKHVICVDVDAVRRVALRTVPDLG